MLNVFRLAIIMRPIVNTVNIACVYCAQLEEVFKTLGVALQCS